MRNKKTLDFLLFFILVGCSTCLQNLKIIAPKKIRTGDSGLLTCSYDLDENVQLYTIKWYFNDEEFYRFVPKKIPAFNTFAVGNLQVNVSNSNEYDVTLVNVRKEQSGRYKCEVTEDAPHYTTDIQEIDISVVDVPVTNPTLKAEKVQLKAGERVKANCTTNSFDYAPNITWVLNGEPLNNETLRFKLQTEYIVSNNGINLTHSQLVLDYTTSLFKNGRLHLKCFSEIPPIYKASDSITIVEESSFITLITGDKSSYKHQSSGCGHAISLLLWSQESTLHGISLILGLLIETSSK